MMRDFRDFVVELLSAHARFLIVGAHALTAHGVPRVTMDLDIWIETSRENAARVGQAVRAFGAPMAALGITDADFSRADQVIQFGLPPFRIDILTGLSGVTFADAWDERVTADFEGIQAPYIGREDFIRNKRASGRPKDLGDLASLGVE
jgi:hypothetical protein